MSAEVERPNSVDRDTPQASGDFLSGGGEMGERMRAFDWSRSPLGPAHAWPQSLKTAVRIMLTSRQPFWLGWGPELTYLYNDPYKTIIGGKHPKALGQPFRAVWREIWDVVGPMADTVIQHNEGTYVEAQLLIMERHGYPEETYYTFSYSPVPNDVGGPGGLICANTDDTRRVIGERQLATLRELAARTALARERQQACALSIDALKANARDLPFALVFLSGDSIDPNPISAHSAGAQHLADPAYWPCDAVMHGRELKVVDLGRFSDVPMGGWSRRPTQAAVLPIFASGREGSAGVLVAGLNPFRILDASYRDFLNLVAGQIAAAVAAAEGYEAERRRAEALAELDRAKTTFFSNVSHEFRTPLTLMIGPVEELLSDEEIPQLSRNRLELAHGNALRLLKLVNSLLDFSRIEAGRVQASFEPTDLPDLTRDLASTFRSAIERAGLKFVVDCGALPDLVHVDREMWEKIVLNLLSNALKYTLAGEVAVRLFVDHAAAILEVSDTGVGVPKHALPRLFERFYRVEGTHGRSQEGSGIGLALVRELVELHAGSIHVESELGRGTTFRVRIPLGIQHLPTERVKASQALARTTIGAQAFVQEALRWLPRQAQEGASAVPISQSHARAADPRFSATAGARIVLADDNTDMRSYVHDLLSPTYSVEIAADGQQALDAARRTRPDLILSDVMMPNLDGFGLLKAIRAEHSLSDVPIILLSARAGEEARIEGLDCGADDYLVKPFSARELRARVGAMLERQRLRADALERERALREEADAATARLKLALSSISDQFFTLDRSWRYTLVNERVLEATGMKEEELLGHSIFECFPAIRSSALEAALTAAVRERRPQRLEFYYPPYSRWLDHSIYPTRDGVAVLVRDITERRRQADWLAGQKRILEMVATGRPLHDVLDEIMQFIELQEPGILCGLLLTEDGPRFKRGSGPSIPKAYWDALHEALTAAPITPPYFAPHNEAVDRGVPVWVADVDTETRYAPAWRQLMLASGLRAVRSTPFRSAGGEILGCLSVYFRLPRTPDPTYPQLADLATNLASIAIERERANRALRGHTAQFEKLLNEAPLGVYLLDSELRILEVNPTARPVFGDIPDLIGRNFDEVIHILWPKAYADEVVDRFRRTLATGEPYFTPERIEQRLDKGVTEYYEWEIHRLPLVDGRYGVVCYFRDISSHVLARARLEAADRQKNEFLAMLAHELRNPLAPIRNAGEILARTQPSDERMRQVTDILRRQVTQLTRLVDDLLDVARITQGRIELKRRPVQIAEIVAHALETVGPLLSAKNHRISVVSGRALHVNGDPARLVQALGNILTNAVKYTDVGGRIQIKTSEEDECAVLSVTDDGAGIPSELLPQVFELFVQSDRTLDRSQGGLGIGLSVVKRLVEMHEGTVSVFSAGAGKGSSFTIRLPLISAELAHAPAPASTRTAALRILIVDDNADAASSLAMILQLERHTLLIAHDGSEALQAVERDNPQVVLLDIGLPGMDGYEVARRIRATEKGRHICLIALTGYGQAEDKERARAAGFNDHLTKPVEFSSLAHALEMATHSEHDGVRGSDVGAGFADPD